MRGLKNNGRLLCSPGTSFAPLGLGGAHRHTDRTTDMATPRPTRPSGAELVKTAPNGADNQTETQTDTRTCDSMTESAQWGGGNWEIGRGVDFARDGGSPGKSCYQPSKDRNDCGKHVSNCLFWPLA